MDSIPNVRVRKILEAIRKDRSRLQHLLFYGPPGSGKTSTAKIFIENWYKDNKKILVNTVGDIDALIVRVPVPVFIFLSMKC